MVLSSEQNRTPVSHRLGGLASISSREKTRLALLAAEAIPVIPVPSTDVNVEPPLVLSSERSRIPAALRLGGIALISSSEKTRLAVLAAETSPVETDPTGNATTATSAAKRKSTRVVRKRVARSPLQGLKLKKANVARSLNPPKKRLCTGKSWTK
ncbi:unnamed protein product [Eruca vesicaria subsp. sativa]|uniref:Uncharacterized protein n=1 Tax=Eruca vesicaria subsp. sativa TaxID=29727 RepID=A0ABC8JLG1_ERUVS|nr:unnamed protein product [Eruca vesicaria subsp. sativa]